VIYYIPGDDGDQTRRRRRTKPGSLLRNADGDGIAEAHTVFIGGLHSPFGMALVGNPLYIAKTDADALPLQSWRDAD